MINSVISKDFDLVKKMRSYASCASPNKMGLPQKKKKKEKTLHSSFLFEYSFHLVITLGLSLMHIKLWKLSEAT